MLASELTVSMLQFGFAGDDHCFAKVGSVLFPTIFYVSCPGTLPLVFHSHRGASDSQIREKEHTKCIMLNGFRKCRALVWCVQRALAVLGGFIRKVQIMFFGGNYAIMHFKNVSATVNRRYNRNYKNHRNKLLMNNLYSFAKFMHGVELF